MDTQKDQQNQVIGFYTFLSQLYEEFVSRTGNPKGLATSVEYFQGHAAEEAAADLEKRKESEASLRAIRSALAAFYLRIRTKPSEIRSQSGIMGEAPSPSVVIDAVVGCAVRGMLNPGVEVTAGDWERFPALQQRACQAFDLFFACLIGVVSTERTNAQSASVTEETDRPARLSMVRYSAPMREGESDIEVLEAGGCSYVLLFKNQLMLAEGLGRIPLERRAPAVVEINRFAEITIRDPHSDSYADFAHLVELAVAIYG